MALFVWKNVHLRTIGPIHIIYKLNNFLVFLVQRRIHLAELEFLALVRFPLLAKMMLIFYLLFHLHTFWSKILILESMFR